MQRVMNLGLHRVSDMRDLPPHEVALCRGWRDAVKLCMKQSNVKRLDAEWARLLDMSESSLHTILNYREGEGRRKRYLDLDLIETIQRLAGNHGISQFLTMQSHGLLNHQSSDARIKQLKAELAQLEESA